MAKFLVPAFAFLFSAAVAEAAEDACRTLSDDLSVQEKALAANYADAVSVKGEGAVLLQLRVNGVLTIIQTLVAQLAHHRCEVPARAITAAPYLEQAVECSIALAKQRRELAGRHVPPNQVKEPDVCERKAWIAK